MGLVAVFTPGTEARFSQFGVPSLIFYLIAYTFTNLGAFGALAAISRVVGGDNLSDLHGLHKRNLGLAALMAVFVLSLAGIPPLSGFLAKFLVFQAAWESGAIWLVYYYLRILKAMFVNEAADDRYIPVPAGMNFSLILSAVMVVVLGVLPSLFLPAIDAVTQTALLR
jgi:NADH-quinone oxidoreductase subunit N